MMEQVKASALLKTEFEYGHRFTVITRFAIFVPSRFRFLSKKHTS